MLFVDDMDDWKLKVRPVVKLEEKPNVFVSLFLSSSLDTTVV